MQIFSLPENVYQTEPEPILSQLEDSFTALNTFDNYHNDEDSDDGEVVRNNFDIETLVDECFMNHNQNNQRLNQFNEPIIDQS